MIVNPALKRLGFAEDDRVVVLHADDIGMCQSTLPAWEQTADFGVLSSAATMTPCPWFAGLARAYKRRAGESEDDMGVHLTLNCEWADYRWGAVRAGAAADGLTAPDGGFHQRAVDLAESASVDAVAGELRAQIDRALDHGIDVTHIDTHMLTLWHPRFFDTYMRLAFEYGLPLFMMRRAGAMYDAAKVEPEQVAETQAQIDEAEAQGMVFFDMVRVLPLDKSENRLGVATRALKAARPGSLTNILIHPAVDTPELRAIAPDWRSRVADFKLFTNEAWRKSVVESGVRVVGFRVLRDTLRHAMGWAGEGG